MVFTTHTLCSLSTSALLICIIFFSTSAEVKAHISERLRVPNAAKYISMAEARKMLNAKELKELKWTVEDYIKYGKENALNKQWIKELENASARFHISRLESLKLQTQQSLEVLYGNQLDIVDKTMRNIYSESLYRTAFEVQKGFGVGFAFDKLDENRLSKVIGKPWAMDGVNFSNRIWKNKEKLINELHSTLVRNIISGSDPAKAIKEIENKMNVSRSAAGRLIMTESAYFSSVAQKDMFNELDVEKYQIVATLDNRTSEICSELDGKVFDMKDYEAGVTAPPFHPNCRTTTIPYFDDWEELGVDPERIARDEEGNNYYVPADMTYKEWKKKYTINNNNDAIPQREKPLTQKDLDAVEYYVSGDGMYINDYLRNRDDPIERMGKMTEFDNDLVQNLTSATSRKHSNKILYRSVDASAVFGDISDEDWDALRNTLLYNLDGNAQPIIDDTLGKVIADKGFMSTTKKYGVASEFDDFTGAEHPIIIEFTNADKVKGFDLAEHFPKLDNSMQQAEVLLSRDTKYKIKSISGKDGHIYLKAEFVDNVPDLNTVSESGKINDRVMNGLSSISQIKSDNDIKQFAEKLIDNLGIDRSNIPVSIKAIQSNGYCQLGNRTTQSKIYFDEYVLNSNDARSTKYRIKTAFHESFHLSANGLEWDGLDSSGSIVKEWRSLEETFTESSAHYLINKYGFSDKLSPSYAQELVENLPRLKKLTKYSSCSTIQDFGEIAFRDRQNGVGAKWLQLHSDMSNVVLPIDYYSQYNSYITNNEDNLFDMFFENLVGYNKYRSQMKAELKSAMGKDFWSLSGNEKLVYSNILACAMQKVGVL